MYNLEKLVYFILFCIIIIFILCNNSFEQFNSNKKSKKQKYVHQKETTKNLDFLNSDVFADVITYTNDDDDSPNQVLGTQKCAKNPICESCVEFGVSGKAFCYPPYKPANNSIKQTKQNKKLKNK